MENARHKKKGYIQNSKIHLNLFEYSLISLRIMTTYPANQMKNNKINLSYVNRRKGDVSKLVCNSNKIYKTLNCLCMIVYLCSVSSKDFYKVTVMDCRKFSFKY